MWPVPDEPLHPRRGHGRQSGRRTHARSPSGSWRVSSRVAFLALVSPMGPVAVAAMVCNAMLVIVVQLITRRHPLPGRWLTTGWLLSLPLTAVLLHGVGTAWLPVVDPDVWGGLLLTFLLASISHRALVPGRSAAGPRPSESAARRQHAVHGVHRGRPGRAPGDHHLPGGHHAAAVPARRHPARPRRCGPSAHSPCSPPRTSPRTCVAVCRPSREARSRRPRPSASAASRWTATSSCHRRSARSSRPTSASSSACSRTPRWSSIVGLLELLGIGRAVLAQPEWLGASFEVYAFVAVVFFGLSYTMSHASATGSKPRSAWVADDGGRMTADDELAPSAPNTRGDGDGPERPRPSSCARTSTSGSASCTCCGAST